MTLNTHLKLMNLKAEIDSTQKLIDELNQKIGYLKKDRQEIVNNLDNKSYTDVESLKFALEGLIIAIDSKEKSIKQFRTHIELTQKQINRIENE